MSQNPHTSSRDINDRNDSEEGGDEDGQVHKDHKVDVDETHQANKHSIELVVDPSNDQSYTNSKIGFNLDEDLGANS